MKVVLCNMGYSGYWVACWRELLQRVDLKVFSPETKYPYASDFLSGVPIAVLSSAEMADCAGVANRICAEKPDILVIGGWASPSFKGLAFDSRLKSVKKILMVDSSWEGSLRQILCRFKLRGFVRQFDGIIVGGARGRRFARWIGFKDSQVFRSIYGYDAMAFADCATKRGTAFPHRFCFVGRYALVKGIDTLLKAYAAYRETVEDPWMLSCYGSGPLGKELHGARGVVDNGFVQPNALPDALSREGVFVFPSLREPWGVALAEAAGAGMPLICSNMVTSGDDLVREGENGFVVLAGDVGALTGAMVQMHQQSAEGLVKMGKRSLELAADFSPSAWADRWMEAFKCI